MTTMVVRGQLISREEYERRLHKREMLLFKLSAACLKLPATSHAMYLKGTAVLRRKFPLDFDPVETSCTPSSGRTA